VIQSLFKALPKLPRWSDKDYEPVLISIGSGARSLCSFVPVWRSIFIRKIAIWGMT
jgi:hypothetical protein